MNEQEFLKQLYIEHLSENVYWGGVERPRVKHPEKWKRLNPIIKLNESVESPISLENRNVWVWSDLHFFHDNIINFSNRPYLDTTEMNEQLIANFNDYVGPEDVSIWVGDIGFGSNKEINELLDQCNGYKILVIGNHDFSGKKVRNLNFDEIHLFYNLYDKENNVSLVFTHYPMYNILTPWFNVHGHLHIFPKSDTGNILHYNVCCELHDYKPIELKKIIKIAKMRLISAEM